MRAGCLLLALIVGLGWAGQALAQPGPVIFADGRLSAKPSASALPAPPTPPSTLPTFTTPTLKATPTPAPTARLSRPSRAAQPSESGASVTKAGDYPTLPPPRKFDPGEGATVQPLPRPSDTPTPPAAPAPLVEPLPVLVEPPALPLPRWYAEAEFLQWWIQGSRLPPVITSSPIGTPPGQAGILGNPGTLVLFEDQSVSGDVHKGARVTVGVSVGPGAGDYPPRSATSA
jgi:hypothetical protein